MLKRCFRNNVLLTIVSLLIIAAPAIAAPNASRRGKDKREPIVITASRMEADKLGDKVIFNGDVTLKKENMILYSDSMIVFYNRRSKGINEIDAVGNVVVRKEGRVALSDRASYYSRDEKIVLTGDARILEKENQLGGDRITLFMRDDRSIVEGGKVLFYSDREKSGQTFDGGKRK
jgi:lipopolysaccharide export system protein LptA